MSEAIGSLTPSPGPQTIVGRNLRMAYTREHLDFIVDGLHIPTTHLFTSHLPSKGPSSLRKCPLNTIRRSIHRFIEITGTIPDTVIDNCLQNFLNALLQLLRVVCDSLWDISDNTLVGHLNSNNIDDRQSRLYNKARRQNRADIQSNIAIEDAQAEDNNPDLPSERPDPNRGTPARPRDEQATVMQRYVEFSDPDSRNECGNFTRTSALVSGRLAIRGRMVIELPSLNPSFPSYIRRFTLKTTQFGIR